MGGNSWEVGMSGTEDTNDKQGPWEDCRRLSNRGKDRCSLRGVLSKVLSFQLSHEMDFCAWTGLCPCFCPWELASGCL